MRLTIPISCNLDCGGGCPLLAHVENGRVTSIVTNRAAGPYMAGCVRGFQMPRVLYAPDRLTQPLIRRGPRGSRDFRAASWDEALSLIAGRLREIQARHGPTAVLYMGGSGSCRGCLHNTDLVAMRFLSLFGGFTDLASNYSAAAELYVTPHVFGTRYVGMDAGNLQFSRLIILWGANVSDNRFASEMEPRILEAKARGVEIIAIDPRRTTTVKTLATEWIPIWPGTDAALMLATLHVLITEGMVDRLFVERVSVGFEALELHVLGKDDGVPKTPAWAEGVCGTPAATIYSFARRYGRTKPTALIPGYSIQRTVGGEETFRLGPALQIATGNLGQAGGSSGGRAFSALPAPKIGRLPVPPAPVSAAVPILLWPDLLLGGRAAGFPADIHAVYNVGGNYLVQGSDVRKNMRALAQVEFSVTHDYFLTPTAQFSDVVLPATTYLERNDIVIPTGGNYLLYSNQAAPPLAQARNDYDIFCELAERLGFGEAYSEGKDEEGWLRSFVAGSDVPDYEEFKRTGIHKGKGQARVGLADFAADPDAHPLKTPSGKVELSSPAHAAAGLPAVPTCRPMPPDPRYPLRLITPKSRYRTHSQCSNIPWFRQREEHAVWIHPRDAAARGIADGQPALIENDQGEVCLPARVTEDIMAGVVCILEGIWPEFDAEGIDRGGSANVLTCTEPTLPSQGTRTHSVLVEVTKRRT